MSEQEVVVEEVKGKIPFNAEDFTTKPKKATTPEVVENDNPIIEEKPKVEETNQPIVETTTNNSTTNETDDFEVDFDSVVEVGGENAKPKKSVYDSLREIDPELDNEDTAVSKYKTFKEENEKLKILAKGRSLIDQDEDIANWTKMTRLSNDDKAKAALYLEYIGKGYDSESAQSRAEEDFDELSELKPKAIQDKAMEYTSFLKRNIELKTKFIEDKILENNIDLNVEDKVLGQVESSILEITEFLGMQLPKDADKRTKVLKDAGDFAKSVDFKKALKDPKTLSEIALYLKYKDNWAKNIKQKGVSKTTTLDKMATAPAITPTKSNHAVQTDKPKNGFSPVGFK